MADNKFLKMFFCLACRGVQSCLLATKVNVCWHKTVELVLLAAAQCSLHITKSAFAQDAVGALRTLRG
ncbi:MAG: hypothetical protein AABZ32_08270, partial [Bacteroidota bacterium]